MGIFSWFRGSGNNNINNNSSKEAPSSSSSASKTSQIPKSQGKEEVPGMHGAVEVSRLSPLADVTVFEFGSAATSNDKVTLAGYCPVSDELEPCRWEILTGTSSDAPQFRVVF